MPPSLTLNPRHWFIRTLTAPIWRRFPARKLRALQEFALVEKDSGNQLLECIPLVSDPKLKAHLFQHVLEEIYHGEIFDGVCKELSSKPLPLPMKPLEDLISGTPNPETLVRTLAYVHVGERAVNRDFLQFANSISEPSLRRVFLRAGGDEGKHEGDTGDILFELSGSNKLNYFWNMLRAQCKRSWALYTSAMRRFGELWLAILLTFVYFLFGALAAGAIRNRFKPDQADQKEALRLQVAEFEKKVRGE